MRNTKEHVWSFLPEELRITVQLVRLFNINLKTLKVRQKSYVQHTGIFQGLLFHKDRSRNTFGKIQCYSSYSLLQAEKTKLQVLLVNSIKQQAEGKRYSKGQAGEGLFFLRLLPLCYSSPFKWCCKRSITQPMP